MSGRPSIDRSGNGGQRHAPSEALLGISGLSVEFNTEGGRVEVVSDVSFEIPPDSTVGLVGESGSGKTVTALTVLGLLARNGRVTSGEIRFGGKDLLTLPKAELRQIRGNEISMIFQEPMTSLNPAFTVGEQIAETVRQHEQIGRKEAWDRAVSALDAVHIPRAASRAHDYPHQFSGGMRQRVMIAMALVCSPTLLIADEPTTALDVTVQARVLDLLKEVQDRFGMSVLLVTHDLGVVADVCDSVVVMYAGQVVERSDVMSLFDDPHHPYSHGLLNSMPTHRSSDGRLSYIPGRVPAPAEYPTGCRFFERCPHGVPDECAVAPVELTRDGHRWVRCARWNALDLGKAQP